MILKMRKDLKKKRPKKVSIGQNIFLMNLTV